MHGSSRGSRRCGEGRAVRRRAFCDGVLSNGSKRLQGEQVETSSPRELTVSDPAAPDPAQIQRGSVALTSALRLSTLLPREQEAIFSVLRSLNTADDLLPRLVGLPGWDAYPARLLVAIVDNYRRELANLGR